MKTLLRLTIFGLWLGALNLALGQSEDDVKLIEGTHPTTGAQIWKAEWPSVSGRTYFLRISGNMVDWQYIDWIEQGTGGVMEQELLIPPGSGINPDERIFIELRWSDAPIDDPETTPVETDPADADFDHDGITNGQELSTTMTDPLTWDTDGDGLADDWEYFWFLDPNDDGSGDASKGADGDFHVPGGPVVPNSVAQQVFFPVDLDEDGVDDGFDAHPGNPEITWSRVSFQRYEVEEIGQSTTVGDPIDINDRGDVLFRRHVWERGQSSPTQITQPGDAKYLWITTNGEGDLAPEERTATLGDDGVHGTFPDGKAWDPLAINNDGAIIGNGWYPGPPEFADNGGTYRGIYWSEPGSPVVTNPKQPYEHSYTFFYDLTHNFRIYGVDTQLLDPAGFSEIAIPPLRDDLVQWGRDSRPTRLAKFGIGEALPFASPTHLNGDFIRPTVGDHRGLLLFGGHAFDTRTRELITPSGFHNDLARVGDEIVFVGDTGGVVSNGAPDPLIGELAGKGISAAGQVLSPSGERLWMNGRSDLLDGWVEPNVTLRQYRFIEGFAISDTGVIAATGRKDGADYYLLLKPALINPPMQVSANDATGPRYRKIALNGLPLPDEAPESTAETDAHKEQSYIDAFNRSLMHQTSDIYVPIGASDLVLQVTRSYKEEIWNDRHGLAPDEEPMRPFGAGWTSNICSYIELVERTPEGSSQVEPISVTVVDEEGRGQSFGSYYGKYYFPMPSGRVEKKTYLNTLSFDDTLGTGGQYVYRKKFGNTLYYEPGFTLSYPMDREENEGDQDHSYARLVKVEDRYGNSLHYDYGGDILTLIPQRIYAGEGRANPNTTTNNNSDLDIWIERYTSGVGIGKVKRVIDPLGNVTEYDYVDPTSDNGVDRALEKVAPPGFDLTNNPAALYGYSFAEETVDHHPRAGDGREVKPKHLRLTALTDANGNSYAFSYRFDTTVLAYHEDASGNQYQQTGMPSLLYQVLLPGSRVTSLAFSGESGFVDPPSGIPTSTKLHLAGPSAGQVDAFKMTWVRDAAGYDRWYQFSEIDVINLNRLPGNKRPDEDGSSTQLIVSYELMDIETKDVGTESYHFDPNAGYALSQATDISGNITTYEYDSEWTTADPAFRYILNNDRFGFFDDPTAEINPLGQVTRYEYGTPEEFRMMKKITHVDGSVTEYTLTTMGRRTDEIIRENNGGTLTTIQHSHFDYDTTFPAFMKKKTVYALESGDDPATSTHPWFGDRVIDYVPYAASGSNAHRGGRIHQEKVQTGTDTLITSYDYDAYGNRTSVTDPRTHTTSFAYDSRNRLETITYPDDNYLPAGVPKKELRYDENSNKVGEKNERGDWMVYQYDELNRLVAEGRDMNGNADNGDGTFTLEGRGTDIRTDYTYNDVNSVLTVQDPNGNTTTHTYDSAQRRRSTTVPLEGTEEAFTEFFYENHYDSASRHDGLNDLAGTRRNPGGSVFNREGWKPTRIVDPRGYETLITYDGLYREVSRKARFNLDATTYQPYTLQLLNNLTSTSGLPSSGTSLLVLAYVNNVLHFRTFDAGGNLTLDEDESTLPPDPIINSIRATMDDYFIDPTLTSEEEMLLKAQAFDVTGNPHLYALTETVYTDESRLMETTDPLGKVNRQENDALGRVAATTIALGSATDEAVTSHLYTTTGLLWKTTDAEDRETEFEFDRAGRQTHVVQPDFTETNPADQKKRGTGSPITTTAYDPNGNVHSITDPLGNTTYYAYDKRNRRVAEISAEVADATSGNSLYRPATLTIFDDAGNPTQVIDRRGLGNPSISPPNVNPGGSAASYTTTTVFDPANRPTSVTAPAVSIFGETNPATTTTLTEYDDNGNVIKVTDGEGGITINTYDLANRLKTTTTNPTDNQPNPGSSADDATNITVTNTYDKANNLIQVDDGHDPDNNNAGQLTAFEFDGLNRKTLTSFDPEDSREERTRLIYNAVNLIERQTLDGSDNVVEKTSYAHDDQHRLQTITYHGSTDDNRHYTYDRVGNLQSVVVDDPGSPDTLRSASYTHDTLNRVRTETSANVTHTYTYDAVGNRTEADYAGTYGRFLTSTYDALNRLETCTEGDPVTGRKTAFGYDTVGNLHKRTYPNNATETRVHDARNRLTSLTTEKSNGTDLAIYAQAYDHVGNVRWIDETQASIPDRTLTLSYDRVYRLKTESVLRSGNTQTTTFSYNDAHNRTSKVVSGSGPLTNGTWTYSYGDPANTRNSNQLYQVTGPGTSITADYDAKGNLTSRQEGSKTLTYTYDHDNRLIKATTPNNYTVPDGTNLSGSKDYEFQYDYRTRRVYRKERTTGQTFGETAISFSGGLSVQEYNGATASGSPKAHYVRGSDFGGGIGGVLFSLRGTNNSLTPSYYHYNSRGDVTTKTNDSAANTWQTAYQTHGEHLAADTFGTDPDPHRNNTKEETGDLRIINDHFRVRFTDIGVYLQRDPAGLIDGPNVYTWVKQNPRSYWDPLGLKYSEQFDGDGYIKTDDLKGRQLDKANRFNDSWKKIRETKAGKALNEYIRDHKRTLNVDLDSSAKTASVRNHLQGATLDIGDGRKMTFNVTAEEMIHVGQNFAGKDFEAKNPRPAVVGQGGMKKFEEWEDNKSMAEGNFIPELPTYVKGDSPKYDIMVTDGTDGTKEVQAMRGVNILRYQYIKKNSINPTDGKGVSNIFRPADPAARKAELKRFWYFRSANHGANFYGEEFGTYKGK